eukprot:TRINITY_DN21056_c0_g1_i1.p1 TRINITY_DN21056_c0_g1~~TRINITY_DN21056_c0_g1_i1.p1  ORF type:complete len:378 (+),score=50.33 TRINITY_DN21056_c0_g1_i1:85-1134(+)
MVREFAERVQSDIEASSASSVMDDHRSRASWSKRLFFTVLGGGALLGGALMLAGHSFRPDEAFNSQGTVRSLLISDEFADVSASTMADTTNQIDKAEIRQIVVHSMKPLVTELEAKNPQTFGKAVSASFSMEQREAALAAVGRMKDPRVQSLGVQVAAIVQKHSNKGLDGVQRELAAAFQNRGHELMQMRDAFFPGMGKLDKDNCRLFQGLREQQESDVRRLAQEPPSNWPNDLGSFNSSVDVPTSQKLERALAIIAGILEQAHVALAQASYLGEAFGKGTVIPAWATGMVAGVAFFTQLSSCIIQAEGNSVVQAMCPMRYASAAADFLASFEGILGMIEGPSSTEQPR